MVSNWAGRSLGCSPRPITHAGARSRRGWSSSPPTSAGASRGRGNNPSELQYPLRRRPPWRIAVSHSLVLRKSELTLQALDAPAERRSVVARRDRKSTRLNSSHLVISYAVFCLKKKKQQLVRALCPSDYARLAEVFPRSVIYPDPVE